MPVDESHAINPPNPTNPTKGGGPATDDPATITGKNKALTRSDPPAPSATDQIVEQWFVDFFAGSGGTVARVTEAWNEVFAAKEVLKKRLAASKTKEV